MIYVNAKSKNQETSRNFPAESFEMIVKTPTRFGSSAHVILPVSSIGKKVVVVIVD